MAVTLSEFARELRAFDGRRQLTKSLRRRINRPVPQIKRNIQARALATLPSSNGLAAWVAQTRVTTQVKLSGRTTAIRLRGRRRSSKANSDVKAINRGRVRAPSWGRRTAGSWHVQQVQPEFFTVPATDMDVWRVEIVEALDDALRTIRG